MELRGAPGIREGDNMGYVTFGKNFVHSNCYIRL
jgi:hypothetical protein